MPEPGPGNLSTLVAVLNAHNVALPEDPVLASIAQLLLQRYGEHLQAIVLYGSYLRGERDTLLDCYALLDNNTRMQQGRWHWLLQWLLPPNVYYLSRSELGTSAHAKCATIPTERLRQAITTDSHSYFWSRFAQPCALVYAKNPTCAEAVIELRAMAVQRCLREAVRLVPAETDALTSWRVLFEHTYRAELRSEPPDRALQLVGTAAQYYQALSSAGATASGSDLTASATTRLWRWRRRSGKALSLLRLVKAALTFSDGLDYLLWKVERHSGVHLQATQRQRRYPLLFAWPLVWRAYRAGGFR